MKKIVALVLALVLALSLATVAFAADESYFSTKVGGLKMTGVTLKEVKAAGEKNVAVYCPVVTVNGSEVPMALNLVVATEADYDFVFVSGDEVTYLKNSVNGAYCGEAKAVAGVAADDAVCGDLVVTDGVSLYEMDGKYYKAVGSFNLRTVLGNAAKDYVEETVTDMIGFTKENLMAALKDGLLNNLEIDAHDVTWKNVSKNLGSWVAQAAGWVIDNAKNNEDYGYGNDEADVKLFLTIADFQEALAEAFTHVADKTNNFVWDLFDDAKQDVVDNVIAYVCDKLGFEADDDASYPSDADYNGGNIYLNIAREVLKQGTSVKALALVDGKMISLAEAVEGTDYEVVAHVYAADYATVEGKTVLTKVYCSECGAEFEFLVGDETAAVEKFGEGNFANITSDFQYAVTTKFLGKHTVSWSWDTMSFGTSWDAGTAYVWDLLDTDARNIMTALGGAQLYVGTAAAEVDSAKTFDAGVALYAGMALMSVAGTAVVIGKKKEF